MEFKMKKYAFLALLVTWQMVYSMENEEDFLTANRILQQSNPAERELDQIQNTKNVKSNSSKRQPNKSNKISPKGSHQSAEKIFSYRFDPFYSSQ